MRRLLFFIFLLLPIGVSADEFENTLITNGNELYFVLNEGIKGESGAGPEIHNMRFGNLVGYFDAVMSQYRLTRRCESEIPQLSRIQSWLLVKNWMDKNPKDWELPPWLIITMSHNDSWPCATSTKKAKNNTGADDEVNSAIKNNSFLIHWQKTNSELWKRAIKVDDEFKGLEEYSSHSLTDRFEVVVKKVLADLQVELRQAHERSDKAEADRLWLLMQDSYP